MTWQSYNAATVVMRLPRQHLKTTVFKCFLAMTGCDKFRGGALNFVGISQYQRAIVYLE